MKAPAGDVMARACAAVVDLADARDCRRVRDLHAKLRTSVERNKRILARLFQSGLLYTRAGARLGRELLVAHQQLLKVGDVLARAAQLPRPAEELEALARQIEPLLERAGELSQRSDGMLLREP
jgi:hypothetical protein